MSRPRVAVIGLGPAGPDLLTAGTLARIDAVPHRYLRTRRHPAAAAVPDARVLRRPLRHRRLVRRGVRRHRRGAGGGGRRARRGALRGAGLAGGRRAHRRAAAGRRPGRGGGAAGAVVPRPGVGAARRRPGRPRRPAGRRPPLRHRGRGRARPAAGRASATSPTCCPTSSSRSTTDPRSSCSSASACPTSRCARVAWDDLDRAVEPDHLTSLWIPALAAPVAGEVARFHELVRTLRAECPWDREQTHASLTRHLLEETYEVLEAIDHVDEDAGTGFEALEEELGDLLFQVVFHSVLAAEEGQFTLADVARGIHDKLYARHPHVFDPQRRRHRHRLAHRRLGAPQGGGEGPRQRDGRHPRRPPGAGLRRQGPEEGREPGRPVAHAARRRRTTSPCASSSWSTRPAPPAPIPRPSSASATQRLRQAFDAHRQGEGSTTAEMRAGDLSPALRVV